MLLASSGCTKSIMTTNRMKDIEVPQKTKDKCNARAQEIVLDLIDGIESEKQFLEQLRWINQSHYQDIIEERAISRLCGYPLCEGKLSNVPKKKYQISVVHNKVFDITERKFFCSNQCYKASMYLKAQLHTSPLWLGDRGNQDAFFLLTSQTELIGEEITFGIERVKMSENSKSKNSTTCEVNNIETESFTPYTVRDGEFYDEEESDSEDYNSVASNQEDIHPEKLDSLPCKSTLQVHEDIEELVSQNSSKCSNAMNMNPRESNTRETSTQSVADSNKRKTSTQSIADLVRHVEFSVREWMTVDSLRLIFGDVAVIDMFREKSYELNSDYIRKYPFLSESILVQSQEPQVPEFCEEREDPESSKFELPSEPFPNFNTLKKETEEIEVKVKAFYRGDKKVSFAESGKESTTTVDYSRTNVLPAAIHHHAQDAIRRNIVLNKLKFVFPDLCDKLTLNLIAISSKVKELSLACNFSAHNITFKPIEWNLIGLILLKLLSVRDHSIHTSLDSKSGFLTEILMSYHLQFNYLDFLTNWLSDLDFILQRETKS